jgi:hypothetical protein
MQKRAKSAVKKYRQLRVGAKTFSKMVSVFERNPEATVRTLFREAASGRELTRPQRRYLLKSISNLKKNQVIVESIAGTTSPREILSAALEVFNLKIPEQSPLNDSTIKSILDSKKGRAGLILVTAKQLNPAAHPLMRKTPFGLTLVIEDSLFKRINNVVMRSQFKERTIDPEKGPFSLGTTVRALLENPITGKIELVPITILPKTPIMNPNETMQHEKSHAKDSALGIRRFYYSPIETKEIERKNLLNSLHSEIVAYTRDKDFGTLFEVVSEEAKENHEVFGKILTPRETSELKRRVQSIGRAFTLIPHRELVEIIRTTPVLKLRKRLDGLVIHEGKKLVNRNKF